MPRTVEGIVESFQAAEARRNAGRLAWDGTLSFMETLGALAKRYHSGDTTLTAQTLLDAFHGAAKEVRSKVPEAKGPLFEGVDEELERFVLTLEEWTLTSMEASADIFDDFDDVLDGMYEWCNRARWWVSPSW